MQKSENNIFVFYRNKVQFLSYSSETIFFSAFARIVSDDFRL